MFLQAILQWLCFLHMYSPFPLGHIGPPHHNKDVIVIRWGPPNVSLGSPQIIYTYF